MKEIELRNNKLSEGIRKKFNLIHRCTYQFEYSLQSDPYEVKKETFHTSHGDVEYVNVMGIYLSLHIPINKLPYNCNIFYLYLGFTDSKNRQLFYAVIYDKNYPNLEYEYTIGKYLMDLYIMNRNCVMIIYDNTLHSDVATLPYQTCD